MINIGKIQGSLTQAQGFVVNVDTVYVHTNIVKLPYDEVTNPSDNLYEYDELQYTKNEFMELLANMGTKNETVNSICFVKMAENGDIDEVTASEHAELFIEWADGTEYVINDLRSYEGKLYKCLQAHTSQADWTPSETPALWKEVGIAENGIAEWSQPISAADAYMIGDEVMFSDTHYRSLIDNNVWSPTAYPQGWEVIE